MDKIASPQDLQNELRRLVAYAEGAEGVRPSREKLASELHELATRVAGVPEQMTHRMKPSEVAGLPVGTIVWEWVRDKHSGPLGRVDGSPWVVNEGKVLLPIAVLPERASGEFPDDGVAPARAGKEFVVVNKGRGKLMTNGVARKLTETWKRKNRDLGRM